MARIYLTKILGTLALFYSTMTIGAPSEIRVLSWFGYISRANKDVAKIEQKCSVQISVDEFYTNAEFLSSIQSKDKNHNNYDIIVYSDTVSSAIMTQIRALNSPNFSLMVDRYQKNIQTKFKSENYPKNTLIFQLAMTGILFNKKNISITPTDSLRKIFKDSEGKIVVLLDDHVEIQTLLKRLDCKELPSNCKLDKNSFFPSEESLKDLVGNAKVSITNDIARLVEHPDFSFAYLWSGESFLKTLAHKNLEFIVHEKLSHVSMDLLSALNNKSSTECVARELGSAQFLESIAKSTFYFSPYGKIKGSNEDYDALQNSFYSRLPDQHWIHKVSIEESKLISQKWQSLKIKIQTPLSRNK